MRQELEKRILEEQQIKETQEVNNFIYYNNRIKSPNQSKKKLKH